ncbi:hypothetical protein [Sphingomonas olei]|uniref:Uncharacterized protein n=1 Tax=Sphingomonas olei TaxID=1886787 RepID=A0ABY2QG15_9SPHN|nr:hypothetical protein [Sphingomonas olei]THG37834.1 hypothetical protein E5988_15095 [Sphingomonas olei]
MVGLFVPSLWFVLRQDRQQGAVEQVDVTGPEKAWRQQRPGKVSQHDEELASRNRLQPWQAYRIAAQRVADLAVKREQDRKRRGRLLRVEISRWCRLPPTTRPERRAAVSAHELDAIRPDEPWRVSWPTTPTVILSPSAMPVTEDERQRRLCVEISSARLVRFGKAVAAPSEIELASRSAETSGA